MSARPEDVLAVWDRAIEMVAGFDDADHADDGDTPIIAPLLADMREARAAVAKMVAVKRRLEGVRELCGAVEDGSCQTVSIGQDDATRSWIVSVGGKFFAHAPTFDAALDAALARMQDGAQ